MSTPALSPGLLVALAAGAILLVFVACLVAMQRLPLERRARFAKLLGHMFVVLIAATVILGMVAQTFR